MIAILVIWLYIFFISSVYGFLLFKLISNLKLSDMGIPSLFMISLLGLALLSCFLSIFSLWFGIGLAANIIILTGAVIISFFYWSQIVSYKHSLVAFLQTYPFISLVSVLGVVAILMETASEVKIYDTGLYHAQAIQWINNFGVVPGLGNLHQRFAFNNHSFLLEALFNFYFIKIQTFHALNGYVTVLFTLCIIHYFVIAKKPAMYNQFLTLLLVIPFFFYTKFISSASPDIQVALMTCLIFIIYLKDKQHVLNFNFWSILIISAYIITVKQSSIPIALISIYYLIKNIKHIKRKELFTIIGIGCLFFIPYMIRNIFISGYLVYPFSKLDLFNVDWKIPKEYVDQMTTILKGWARTKEWSVDKSFSVWFSIWYHKLTLFNKLSVISSLVLPIMFVALHKLGRFKSVITEKFAVLFSITFIYTIFWLLSVPELRYIFYIQTFIGVLAIISSYKIVELYLIQKFGRDSLPKNIISEKVQKYITWCLLTFMAILFVFSLKQSFSTKQLVQHYFLPPKYPTAKTSEINSNNIIIKTPVDDQLCWDTCIPCSLIQGKIGINPNIALRGTKLSEGFMSIKK